MIYKKFAVIGLGLFGSALVRHLYEAGHEVVAIDQEMERVDALKDMATEAVCLDATDEKALAAQGVTDMDAVIVAISDFENLISTANNLIRLGVERIMARYQTELDVKILKMLGIKELYNPEERAAFNMAEQFNHNSIRNNMLISEDYRITEIITPESMLGDAVAETDFADRYSLKLVSIKRPRSGRKRKAESLLYDVIPIEVSQTPLKKNDVLVIFGRHKDIERFLSETI